MIRCRNIAALLFALASYLVMSPAQRAAYRREQGWI